MSTPRCSCPPDTALAADDRPDDRPLVLHADAAWLVVDKPAGLPSVPGRAPGLQDCAASRVQARYPDALVVHRLDMATSGLMLMARGAERQRRASADFAQRRVDKRYLARVAGTVAEAAGTIDLPLSADWPNRPRQQIDTVAGKPSLTRWQRLAVGEGHSVLLLQPVTGRSHQLRVHLAAIGHPILGDTLYAPPAVRDAAPRLLLHAWRLTAPHPDTGEPTHFESPPPFDCQTP